MSDTKAAAKKRIDVALNQIEAAQRLMGDACATLSRITYLDGEWEKTGEMYDKIKAHWHVVANARHYPKIDLDSEAKADLLTREGKAS